jgi:disulfide bond formation protein DsbB
MKLPRPRLVWLLVALGSAGLVAASLALTALLGLHPCHLCIFQRVLFMVLAVLGGLAAWRPQGALGLLAGLAVLPVTAAGVAAAGYQSWLQVQPAGSASCVASEPTAIELFIEWLGRLQPELFLASGFCENAELTIFGLSLANWALVAHAVIMLLAALALYGRRTAA